MYYSRNLWTWCSDNCLYLWEEKLPFNLSVNYRSNIGNFIDLRTFDGEHYVNNTEMRIYGHMTANHLFITQATDHHQYFWVAWIQTTKFWIDKTLTRLFSDRFAKFLQKERKNLWTWNWTPNLLNLNGG